MKKKIFWTIGIVIAVFIGLGVIGSASDSNKSSSVKEAFQDGMDQGKQMVDQTNPESTKTPEEQIEAKVSSIFSDDKKIKTVRATKQVNGGYGVFVSINASDNLSNDLIKKGIWLDMAKIYTALYKGSNDISEVSIVANMDVVDKYGKTSNQAVMKTSLAKEEAQKVNWNLEDSALGLEILPNVWQTYTNKF